MSETPGQTSSGNTRPLSRGDREPHLTSLLPTRWYGCTRESVLRLPRLYGGVTTSVIIPYFPVIWCTADLLWTWYRDIGKLINTFRPLRRPLQCFSSNLLNAFPEQDESVIYQTTQVPHSPRAQREKCPLFFLVWQWQWLFFSAFRFLSASVWLHWWGPKG